MNFNIGYSVKLIKTSQMKGDVLIMCNRCSNYYYGGNCSQNWGTSRSLNRCRNALQNLSDEAANAADLVSIAEAFEDRCGCGCNSGYSRSGSGNNTYDSGYSRSGCGCNHHCHSNCGCNRCQYRRCVRNCQRYL